MARLLNTLRRAENNLSAKIHQSDHRRSPLLRYGVAVCLTMIALSLTLGIRIAFPQVRYLLFCLIVTFSTWYGGLGPGLVATLLTIVGVNYYFQDPLYTLNISPLDLLVFVVFGSQAVVIDWLQHGQREARVVQTRLAAIVEGSDDAIIGKDLRGIITSWNRGAERMYGYRAEEIVGQPLARLVPSDRADEVPAIIERIKRGERVASYETKRIRKDGVVLDVSLTISPVYNADGQIIGASKIARDITERVQTHKLQTHLAAIVESSDDAIIGKDLNGIITSWNRGAERMYGYRAEEMVGQPVALLVPPDQPNDVPMILARIKRGERVEHYETRRRAKDGRVLDVALTVSPIYDRNDTIVGASKIARDITARKRTERLQRFLDEASELLMTSFDYETTLQGLAQRCVPTLADWCSIHVLQDNGQLHTVDIVAANPERLTVLAKLRQAYPFNPDSPAGLAQVLRTGEALFLPQIDPEGLQPYARNNDHLNLIRQLGTRSSLLLPLQARGRVLGVISLNMADSNRHYDQEDYTFAKELAQRAALAVDNARLYQAAQQAQQTAEHAAKRASKLLHITSGLSSAVSLEAVGRIILTQGSVALGAAGGLIVRLNDTDAMLEIVYATGYTPELVNQWRRFSVDTDIPLAETVRTAQPIWVDSPESGRARYPAIVAADPGNQAWAALPLVVNGQVVGGLGFNFAQPQSFPAEERNFMLTLAQECALATERARLFEEVQTNAATLQRKVAERTEELQAALVQAQSADRTKTTMLRTVSHEMRTPLSTIIGFSSLILQRDLMPDKTVYYAELINKDGRRLARLVNNFLDLQRIASGRQTFTFTALDLVALIQEELAKLLLDEGRDRTIRLEASSVPHVFADSDAIHRVILNLLSNALKFSSQGDITIALQADTAEVTCSIHDEGMGIPPEELDELFQHFYRSEAARKREIQGTGLGLALCREIIEAHRGRIWAESPGLNQGATFSFTLPIAPAHP